jgi:hypothetical protein
MGRLFDFAMTVLGEGLLLAAMFVVLAYPH